MGFCRFCGKELVNGQCSCPKFQASIRKTERETYQDVKAPFFASSFHPDYSSVSSFMSSIRDYTGINSSPGFTDPYEHNVPIVPGCIQPEENEIVVKQYNIAQLRTREKFMKAEGRMMVTNRRLLFRAAGTSLTGNILQEHQFNLDEIAGLQIHNDYKFSLLNFIGGIFLFFAISPFITRLLLYVRNEVAVAMLSLILGISGLIPTFVVYKRFWLKLLGAGVSCGAFMGVFIVSGLKFFALLSFFAFLVLLINLTVICFVPNLVIEIKTKGGEGALRIGSQKAMFQRSVGDDYSGFKEVLPWEDTVMAMNELGTMIDDLQKQGDYAVGKWSR